MNKKTVFVCEYCGLVFDKEADCEKHEEIHIEDFSKKSNKEISDRLYIWDRERNLRLLRSEKLQGGSIQRAWTQLFRGKELHCNVHGML